MLAAAGANNVYQFVELELLNDRCCDIIFKDLRTGNFYSFTDNPSKDYFDEVIERFPYQKTCYGFAQRGALKP